MRGVERAERSVAGATPEASGQVVAMVGGEAMTRDELWPVLAEAFGREALQEAVLDHELAARARLRGITIGEEDLQRERRRLARSIRGGVNPSPDKGANPGVDEQRVGRIIERIRGERALGPVRFDAFLRRNATLRRLVAPEIEISEGDIQQGFDIVFGERFEVRLIVTATDRQAAKIRGELVGSCGGEDLSARFAASAMRSSIDPSGNIGGQIAPISPIDPAFPRALRSAISSTPPGQLTPVVALDGASALALVLRRLEPVNTTLAQQRTQLEQTLRLRKERGAMDTLARKILLEADTRILDRSLAWSRERSGA